jgi:hypothetical protein
MNGNLMKLKCCIFLMLSLNWHVAHAKPAAETALILTVGPNAPLTQPQPKLPVVVQQQRNDSPWQQQPADAWKTLLSDKTATTSRHPDNVPRWTLPTLIMALLGLLWLISRSQRHG